MRQASQARAWALAAAAAVLLVSGCGTGARQAPNPSDTSSAPSSSVPSAASSVSADQTGAQYAAYYRVNGTATLAAGAPLSMNAADFAFRPNTLTVKVGTPVHINVQNTSSEAHNFDLPAFGVNVNLPPGTTTAVTFTPTQTGTYYFWCNLPGHPQAGMVGKITVTP
jgi:heme/copper-type cytochrome/quinol oxidase subunit 2